MSGTSTNFHLPDECWESVFKFLNKAHYLDTLSLVSNHFLSLTNNLVSSLKVSDKTQTLPRLLTRFPNLRSLDLWHFKGDLHALLLQLSESPSSSLDSLNICIRNAFPADGFRALAPKMQSLKSLALSNIGAPITIADVLLVLQCFPSLRELDLHCYKRGDSNNAASQGPVSDTDIEALSLALPKLRKVKLCGDYLINDSLLFNLCKNCEFLELVELSECRMVSQDGIARAFKLRPNLTSFLFGNRLKPDISSVFIASLVSLKQLTCLKLYSTVSDELLFSVARSGLPLRKLFLSNCSGYSYDGISFLLSKCRLVQHLELCYSAAFLEDKHIKELSKLLGNLMFINLSGCYQLSYLSFFFLTMNCPLLNEINMGEAYFYIPENELLDSLTDSDIIVNFQVKSLRLSSNKGLMDDNVEILAKICPNLEILDLGSCKRMSNGAVEVLKICPNIRYLSLFSHSEVDLSGMQNFQFPNLEVLRLSLSEIDDKALFIISKSCPGLLEALSPVTNPLKGALPKAGDFPPLDAHGLSKTTAYSYHMFRL
ncbi:hypothetical protein RIF29_28618 [Crotalaria pallida]|uniref:Uncharacterized protein n=1 Tax=Crotalaria pallida TaxID=3830 RepID=A0AAN9EJP3_CROPI